MVTSEICSASRSSEQPANFWFRQLRQDRTVSLSTMILRFLRLFVYILGPDGCSFCVTVKSSETVGELKDAILKEKPDQLRDVDAYELVLYKVSLPDDKTLEQSAAQALDEELVVASKKLSELFPIKPPAGTVSIVVKIPRTSE